MEPRIVPSAESAAAASSRFDTRAKTWPCWDLQFGMFAHDASVYMSSARSAMSKARLGKRKQIDAPACVLSTSLFTCRMASTVCTPGMAEQDQAKSGRVGVLSQLQAPVIR